VREAIARLPLAQLPTSAVADVAAAADIEYDQAAASDAAKSRDSEAGGRLRCQSLM